MKQLYVCTACKYKFKRDEKPSKCPYCGATGQIEKERSAQELLDSLTDLDDELGDTRQEMGKYKR